MSIAKKQNRQIIADNIISSVLEGKRWINRLRKKSTRCVFERVVQHVQNVDLSPPPTVSTTATRRSSHPTSGRYAMSRTRKLVWMHWWTSGKKGRKYSYAVSNREDFSSVFRFWVKLDA